MLHIIGIEDHGSIVRVVLGDTSAGYVSDVCFDRRMFWAMATDRRGDLRGEVRVEQDEEGGQRLIFEQDAAALVKPRWWPHWCLYLWR